MAGRMRCGIFFGIWGIVFLPGRKGFPRRTKNFRTSKTRQKSCVVFSGKQSQVTGYRRGRSHERRNLVRLWGIVSLPGRKGFPRRTKKFRRSKARQKSCVVFSDKQSQIVSDVCRYTLLPGGHCEKRPLRCRATRRRTRACLTFSAF